MTQVEFLVAIGVSFVLVLLVTHWMANINLKIRNLESQARTSVARHEATLAVLTSFREALNYEQRRTELLEQKCASQTGSDPTKESNG